MKKCKYCKEDIDKKAKICKHCGKKQKNSIIRNIMIFIGIILVIGALGSLFDNDTNQTQTEKYSFVEEGKIIEEGNEYFKTKYITGTIKNNTTKKTNYVQIVYNLYDESGNIIGSAMDNINYIEPDGTWKFKAIILEEEFTNFKFESISGF